MNVVSEKRLYRDWGGAEGEATVGPDSGLIAAKAALNKLHIAMAKDGYTQVPLCSLPHPKGRVSRCADVRGRPL